MKKRRYFYAVLLALGSTGIVGITSVGATDRVDISQFIGYYRVDVDNSVPDYNCDVRELEFNKDGQLQEFQGLSSATTGTTVVYRFTDYNIVGNVLEGSYDYVYGYVDGEDGLNFAPLSGYSSGRHQMVLMEDGNIISDGQIWYRYDKDVE